MTETTVTIQRQCFFQPTESPSDGCRYLLYLPSGYEGSTERFPLVLFLHGSGERGTDLSRVVLHGLPKEIESGRPFPFIAVSPQCPEFRYFDVHTLSALLDEIEAEYRVDKERVYVTGLSLGGYYTYALAAHTPERFAAIAPICGASEPEIAPRLAKMPIYTVHGTADTAVPFESGKRMADAARAAGAQVEFITIEGAGHNVWSETYAGEDIYAWLLRHRRA